MTGRNRTAVNQSIHDLLTIRDVASELKTSPWSARKLVRDGRIGIVRFGKVILVPRASLDQFISEHFQAPATGTAQ